MIRMILTLTKILTLAPAILWISVWLFVNVTWKETVEFGQNGSPPTIATFVAATSIWENTANGNSNKKNKSFFNPNRI